MSQQKNEPGTAKLKEKLTKEKSADKIKKMVETFFN